MEQQKSGAKNKIPARAIAPCGMNCTLCRAYGREKNPCPGCRSDERTKPKTRVSCRIRNCERLADGKARYCHGCESFPCARLYLLDARYRTRYGMSMIENLVAIKKSGVRRFISDERTKWTCPGCKALLCVHESKCRICSRPWR